MSSRIPPLTAMIASAVVNASASIQLDTRYPPPSCSAFHGRSGSRLWAVMTCGMPWSSCAIRPAPFAYQVWECTRSAPPTSCAIARSVPSVPMAAFARVSVGGTS